MAERIPTAYRVPTGNRGTTGYRGTTGAGQAPAIPPQMQDVHVVNRPVTQYGLTGMKTASKGPGRTVQDKSYYMGVIRQKISELRSEIEKLTNEMEDIQTNNNVFITLERKYDTLIKEVRTLEGELADYNLTLDKKRAETRPEDVMTMYDHIRYQNSRQREALDQLFLERKGLDDEIGQIEQEIAMINHKAEERLNELDPDLRQEYFQLQEENRSLEEEINQKNQMLENINIRLQQADAKLRTDIMKQKAHHLREQKQNLQRRKEDLQVQTNELDLPLPEAKARLMARVKQDNQQIKETETRVKELERTIASYKKSIEEMDNDLRNNDSSEMQKYEVLYQKDKEMTDFIQSFEPTRQSELEMIKNLEENIVDLMQKTSRLMEKSQNIPIVDPGSNDWVQEYQFGHTQMTNAAVTMERLKSELNSRKQDLEKVRKLDQVIPVQLQRLNEDMSRMREELRTKFSNIDTMKQQASEEIHQIQQRAEQLREKKENLQHVLRAVNIKYDTKQKQLQENKIYKEMQEAEQKLAQNEQTIFGLRSYIESKGSETNYTQMMQDCRGLAMNINEILVARYNFQYG